MILRILTMRIVRIVRLKITSWRDGVLKMMWVIAHYSHRIWAILAILTMRIARVVITVMR